MNIDDLNVKVKATITQIHNGYRADWKVGCAMDWMFGQTPEKLRWDVEQNLKQYRGLGVEWVDEIKIDLAPPFRDRYVRDEFAPLNEHPDNYQEMRREESLEQARQMGRYR